MSRLSIRESLTFDDVLLVPQYSDFLPKETDISTQLTRNLRVKLPLLSAAMDTVTEAATAICMARHGGVGIINKNLSKILETQKIKDGEETSEEEDYKDNDFLDLMSKKQIAQSIQDQFNKLNEIINPIDE